jgi:peptide/nickel transport system substrate-binding protein
VAFKVVTEWGTRFAMLKAGDADFAVIPRQYFAQVDPLVNETCADDTGQCTVTNPNGTLRLFKGLPLATVDAIFFNQQVNTTGGNQLLGSGKLDGTGVPPDFFADVHIRKAFNYCFDWNAYIEQVHHGEAEQAFGPILTDELGYDHQQAHYALDLQKCAAEFRAASVTSPEGHSLWETGFSLQYTYVTGVDEYRTVGDILKDNLSKVNSKFQLTVGDMPWPAFYKDFTASRLPLFPLFLQEDYHDPHSFVTGMLGRDGVVSAFQHFPMRLQAQLDRLITDGIQAPDRQARAHVYRQLQQLAYEHALDIFMVQPQDRHYEPLWIKGWYYNAIYPWPFLNVYVLSKD